MATVRPWALEEQTPSCSTTWRHESPMGRLRDPSSPTCVPFDPETDLVDGVNPPGGVVHESLDGSVSFFSFSRPGTTERRFLLKLCIWPCSIPCSDRRTFRHGSSSSLRHDDSPENDGCDLKLSAPRSAPGALRRNWTRAGQSLK